MNDIDWEKHYKLFISGVIGLIVTFGMTMIVISPLEWLAVQLQILLQMSSFISNAWFSLLLGVGGAIAFIKKLEYGKSFLVIFGISQAYTILYIVTAFIGINGSPQDVGKFWIFTGIAVIKEVVILGINALIVSSLCFFVRKNIIERFELIPKK